MCSSFEVPTIQIQISLMEGMSKFSRNVENKIKEIMIILSVIKQRCRLFCLSASYSDSTQEAVADTCDF